MEMVATAARPAPMIEIARPGARAVDAGLRLSELVRGPSWLLQTTSTVPVVARAGVPARVAVFAPGETIAFTALEPSTVMLLGGEPIGPRFIEWNFVSSSKERIEQAKADWRAGRMKLPDLDHDEFIPLP